MAEGKADPVGFPPQMVLDLPVAVATVVAVVDAVRAAWAPA